MFAGRLNFSAIFLRVCGLLFDYSGLGSRVRGGFVHCVRIVWGGVLALTGLCGRFASVGGLWVAGFSSISMQWAELRLRFGFPAGFCVFAGIFGLLVLRLRLEPGKSWSFSGRCGLKARSTHRRLP